MPVNLGHHCSVVDSRLCHCYAYLLIINSKNLWNRIDALPWIAVHDATAHSCISSPFRLVIHGHDSEDQISADLYPNNYTSLPVKGRLSGFESIRYASIAISKLPHDETKADDSTPGHDLSRCCSKNIHDIGGMRCVARPHIDAWLSQLRHHWQPDGKDVLINQRDFSCGNEVADFWVYVFTNRHHWAEASSRGSRLLSCLTCQFLNRDWECCASPDLISFD